jgi:hypothetical protein
MRWAHLAGFTGPTFKPPNVRYWTKAGNGQDSPMIQAFLDSIRSEKEPTKPAALAPAKPKKK